ncbi:hypothetical protein M9Y10_004682 [Tritrichomonas musculus]|uniref:Uncharacterized protein n=1 Tax=Tritrichomonas musculus TaxID=1915356 RepID=A0ABR2JJS4_9EUKA
MQQRISQSSSSLVSEIDHIISELLILKTEFEQLNNKSNEQPIETPTETLNDNTTETLNDQKNEASAGADLSATENESLHPIRRRTNRSFPLNKSKFLNDEQRDQVLEFANQNKELIKNQPIANRIPFLQNLVHEQLNINLSIYMTTKLINLLNINK